MPVLYSLGPEMLYSERHLIRIKNLLTYCFLTFNHDESHSWGRVRLFDK